MYHCTWHGCNRPIFSLTLCRTHYRAANVTCVLEGCQRPSFCKQVCSYHYRKNMIPSQVHCQDCERPLYMNGKCFYHFTERACILCGNTVFSKQLCQAHYMSERRQLRKTKGATANMDTRPDTIATTPVMTNHIPEIQSS